MDWKTLYNLSCWTPQKASESKGQIRYMLIIINHRVAITTTQAIAFNKEDSTPMYSNISAVGWTVCVGGERQLFKSRDVFGGES